MSKKLNNRTTKNDINLEENKQEIKEIKKTKNKNKKHISIKKNIGRLVALIMVISMLLAASATLIFYVLWYLGYYQ